MPDRIIPFLSPCVSFDPDTTRVMGEAFEYACAQMGPTDRLDVIREILARRIIEHAQQGATTDPKTLAHSALASLGLPAERLEIR
jgi:hypothetical protein